MLNRIASCTKQPQKFTSLNPANPLARGIISAGIPGLLFNSVSGCLKPSLGSGTTIGAGLGGSIVANTSSSGGGVLIGDGVNYNFGTKDFSIAVVFIPTTYGVNDVTAIGVNSSGIFRAGRLFGTAYFETNYNRVYSATGFNDNQVNVLIGSRLSGYINVFNNGVGATPIVSTENIYGNGDTLTLGRNGTAGQQYPAGYLLFVVWNRGLTSGEAKSFTTNPWQIFAEKQDIRYFKFGGAAVATATAVGTLTQTVDLTGAGIAIATGSGVINQSVYLGGSAASISVAGGNATLSVTLSGSGFAQSFAVGAINQAMELGGSAQSTATAVGAISQATNLSGAAQAVATATGEAGQTADVSGAAQATTTAVGAISQATDLSGAAQAVATATGAITLTATLSGAAVASVLAAAEFGTDLSLSGDGYASSTAMGAVSSSVSLIGDACAIVTGSGGLESAQAISGAAVTVATSTGDITIAIGLSGLAIADAMAGGSITLSMSMSASALAQVVAIALLTVKYDLPDGVYSIKSRTQYRGLKSLTPRYSIRSLSNVH